MLKGKAAIVTGPNKGISREIALVLAENGADLVIDGNNQEQLEHVKAQIKTLSSRCRVVKGDIPGNSVAARLAAACMETFGEIDILVNNASISSRIPSLELMEEEWRRMMRINLGGMLYCCKIILPHTVHRQLGVVISISFTVSRTAHVNASTCYGASKAAVNSMAQKFTYEMGPHHIRINGVCPGPTETDMSLQWVEEYRKNVVKKIPLGLLGTTKNVADVTVFLASNMAGFINEETINVNGGSYMN